MVGSALRGGHARGPSPVACARWLGAAGFDLRLGYVSVLIDPYLSYHRDALPGQIPVLDDLHAQAVFVTHGHLDHTYDIPSIARQTSAPIYASTSVCEALHDSGVPARQLRPLAGGRQCRVGAVSVRAIPARHVRFDAPTVWRALRRAGCDVLPLVRTYGAYPCGDVLGYEFTVPQGKVLHFGSAGWYGRELEVLHPQVALLPVQGHSRVHLEVAQAAQQLRASRLVLHHYDDCCPPLSEAVDIGPLLDDLRARLPGVEVIVPRIGEWLPLFPEVPPEIPAQER